MPAATDGAMKPTRLPTDRGERRPVSMSGYAVLPGGLTHEISLLDLSYEGCCIETPVALDAGQGIKISVLGRAAIGAEVRWSDGRKAGLVFTVTGAETKRRTPRQSRRTPLAAEISMRRLGRTNFRVNVFDASPEGCKIDMVERAPVGEFLMVKFEGLETMEAEVCWVEKFTAGLRFRKPMHPLVFDLLIARLRA